MIEAIKNRRSIRKYKNKAVDKDESFIRDEEVEFRNLF